jgi:hypothetical protein
MRRQIRARRFVSGANRWPVQSMPVGGAFPGFGQQPTLPRMVRSAESPVGLNPAQLLTGRLPSTAAGCLESIAECPQVASFQPELLSLPFTRADEMLDAPRASDHRSAALGAALVALLAELVLPLP